MGVKVPDSLFKVDEILEGGVSSVDNYLERFLSSLDEDEGGIISEISFLEMKEIMSKSDYASVLGRNVRFLDFKPESMSDFDWKKELGSDVDNFKHMLLAFNILKAFLRSGDIDVDRAEASILLFTALVHDLAESVVGDICFLDKTDLDTKSEMLFLGNILSDLFDSSKKKDFLPVVYIKKVLKILLERDEKLSKLFSQLEFFGYFRTGMNAWKRSRERVLIVLEENDFDLTGNVFERFVENIDNLEMEEQEKEIILTLMNMAIEVVGFHIVDLDFELKFIKKYIDLWERNIEEIFFFKGAGFEYNDGVLSFG